jgi:hypothetical protein
MRHLRVVAQPGGLCPLLLVGLAACRPDAASGEGAAACTVAAIDATWPADGQDPVSRAAAVQLWFSGEVELGEVALELWDAEGSPVAGSVERVDGGLRFLPAAWLEADTLHRWEATVCGVEAGGGFTTGALGEAADPSALEGTTWGLALDEAEWVQPAGGGSLFGQLFSGQVLLGVQAADSAQIDLLSAVGEEVEPGWWQQDPCFETADFDPVDFLGNPYVQAGPVDMRFAVQGVDAVLRDVEIAGAVAADGSALLDGSLVAEFDARDFSSLGSPSQVCDLLEAYVGVSCSACRSDGEESCVPVEVQEVEGARIEGLALQVNEDPSECEDGR